jgi:two-component system NtrC family response regulator
VPPLRERKEDIPLLMDFFAKKYVGRYKKNVKGFTREARDQLIKHDYPGNVRELENMIERAIVLARGDYITLEDIPNLSGSLAAPSEGGIRETVGVMEKQMITEALIKEDWVQTKAASLLGISERMLRYKMKKYAIFRE